MINEIALNTYRNLNFKRGTYEILNISSNITCHRKHSTSKGLKNSKLCED